MFCSGDTSFELVKYPCRDVEKPVGNWSLEFRERGLGWRYNKFAYRWHLK